MASFSITMARRSNGNFCTENGLFQALTEELREKSLHLKESMWYKNSPKPKTNTRIKLYSKIKQISISNETISAPTETPHTPRRHITMYWPEISPAIPIEVLSRPTPAAWLLRRTSRTDSNLQLAHSSEGAHGQLPLPSVPLALVHGSCA